MVVHMGPSEDLSSDEPVITAYDIEVVLEGPVPALVETLATAHNLGLDAEFAGTDGRGKLIVRARERFDDRDPRADLERMTDLLEAGRFSRRPAIGTESTDVGFCG
jgi:hypothetical protein